MVETSDIVKRAITQANKLRRMAKKQREAKGIVDERQVELLMKYSGEGKKWNVVAHAKECCVTQECEGVAEARKVFETLKDRYNLRE